MAEKTIGALSDEMSRVRSARREIAKEDKALKKEYADLEERLIAALDAQDTTKGGSKKVTATINEAIVYNVSDWDRFHAWLRKTNRLFMLERRVSNPAVREYVEHARGHKAPPGTDPFTKRTIGLRDL